MNCKIVGFIHPDLICERYQKEIVHKIANTWLTDAEADGFYGQMKDCAWSIMGLKQLLLEIETRIKTNKDFVQERNRKVSH